ncbi:tryptophan synthase beta subunit-like PLP-dependent enzyme [Mycena galericulata]|nr:tryptophan synthase beta subunit-like PLP-dependent enzyme [Mycena galericulata]
MSTSVYLNSAGTQKTPGGANGHTRLANPQILDFHRLLPNYSTTPLHTLPSVARDLGLGHVFLKDESSRFGLPSFKILGASWAIYNAVAGKLGFKEGDSQQPLSLALLGAKGKAQGLSIVTCTEGNWGRAVARMAHYLDLPVTVFVPRSMPETTRARIRGEGADLVVVNGDYDDSVTMARQKAEADDGALLLMDISWEGYETVPQWVVEGYRTMLDESDEQVLATTGGQLVTHAIVPVGCGSIAQAVTAHFKFRHAGQDRENGSNVKVIAVEPTTAACLRASLEAGTMTSVPTEDTIMCGMNCGTLSTLAWPVLKTGVEASVVSSDGEAHRAVLELDGLGIKAGPCGASTLAALRQVSEAARDGLGLFESSVVVLYCTEGPREYEIPGEK